MGSVVVACGLVGFSWTRDQTCVPCICRQILNHCPTREVPVWKILLPFRGKEAGTISVLLCSGLFFYSKELFQPNWQTPHCRGTGALAESMKAPVEFMEFSFLYIHSMKTTTMLPLYVYIMLQCQLRYIKLPLSAFSSPSDTV